MSDTFFDVCSVFCYVGYVSVFMIVFILLGESKTKQIQLFKYDGDMLVSCFVGEGWLCVQLMLREVTMMFGGCVDFVTEDYCSGVAFFFVLCCAFSVCVSLFYDDISYFFLIFFICTHQPRKTNVSHNSIIHAFRIS